MKIRFECQGVIKQFQKWETVHKKSPFPVLNGINLNIYENLTKDAKDYIEEVKECTADDPWLVCVHSNKPENWKTGRGLARIFRMKF